MKGGFLWVGVGDGVCQVLEAAAPALLIYLSGSHWRATSDLNRALKISLCNG